MFSFIKTQLQKIYSAITSTISELFARKQLDDQTLKDLELILISSDAGVKTTRTIINSLKDRYARGQITTGDDLKKALHCELLAILKPLDNAIHDASVYLFVGINGSGKTTFISKFANLHAQKGKKILLVAGDTFRAAAPEQLNAWAQKIGVDIVIGKEQQDPSSVIFAGCQQFAEKQHDILIIDTAGRLQTKANLMKELEKIKRTVNKQLPYKKIVTFLTIDAMLGQNSFEQARIFNESTAIDGTILTKMDGTGKGGIIFAINQELRIPVAYISFGEQIDDVKRFDAQEYVSALLDK